MEELKSILLGDNGTIGYWIGYGILFVLGAAIYFAMKALYRKDKTTAFSWKFWRNDNWGRVMLMFMFGYLAIRVYTDIYPYIQDVAVLKHDLSQVAGTILMGILNQRIIHYLAKRLKLTESRDAKTFIQNTKK